MMIYFGIVKDRAVELFIRILKRGYSVALIFDNIKNILKENYEKECILQFKMLDKIV